MQKEFTTNTKIFIQSQILFLKTTVLFTYQLLFQIESESKLRTKFLNYFKTRPWSQEIKTKINAMTLSTFRGHGISKDMYIVKLKSVFLKKFCFS